MLLFALVICTQKLEAQCLWLTNYSVDIVPKFSGNLPVYPGCPPLDCDEMMYEVYIRTNPGVFATEFCYSWLSILGKITVNNRDLDGISSFIEVDRSKTQCSPYTLDAAEFSIQKTGEIALNLGDAFNPAFPQQLGQCIPLINGSALLFSVIIHAPLGSTVSWKNTSTGQSPFVSAYGSNAAGGPNCRGEMLVTYGGAPNPTVVMPSPNACPSGITYSFNCLPLQINPGSLLQGTSVPILLSGIPQGTLIEEIEALVEIKTTNYMEFGNIQTRIFNCPLFNIQPCDINVNEYEEGGFKYRRIHAISSNVVYSGDSLLYLNILGPINESLSDCAEVSVKFVRIKVAGTCCTVQSANYNSVQVCFVGETICNDFDLTVSDLPSSSDDCKIKYRVNLSWSYAQQNFSFENLNFILRFQSKLPFSVIENNTLCASCITVTPLGGGSDLYDIVCDLDNTTVAKNSSFDIVFDGFDDCIIGYIFVQSTLKTIGTPKCAPETHPPNILSPRYRCSTQLAGHVEYRLSQICDEIKVEAKATDGDTTCNFVETLVNGKPVYSFCACKDTFPYNVTCSRTGNPNNGWLNGVTTYDLVLISKHILAVEPFNDVFKLYAADANCSGSVTTFDVLELRKLILGINTELVGVPNYKIFNAKPQTLQFDPALCVAEATKIVPSASKNVDFYVVKTGDVNWNWPTSPTFCFTGGGGGDDRFRPSIPLRLSSETSLRGGKVRIPIVFDADVSFAAMQFELKFDPSRIHFQNFAAGEIVNVQEENFGLSRVSDGFIRFAWFSETGTEMLVKDGAVLCYLEFDVLQELTAQEIFLNADSESFHTVAYTADGREQDLVQPSFVNPRGEIKMLASPNPFGAQTRLLLDLPHDDNVVLSIYNALGAIVNVRTLSLSAGRQELLLQSEDVQHTPGVYHVELRSSDKLISTTVVKQ